MYLPQHFADQIVFMMYKSDALNTLPKTTVIGLFQRRNMTESLIRTLGKLGQTLAGTIPSRQDPLSILSPYGGALVGSMKLPDFVNKSINFPDGHVTVKAKPNTPVADVIARFTVSIPSHSLQGYGLCRETFCICVCIILTYLISTCRLYRDRQKPANKKQCPTLTKNS